MGEEKWLKASLRKLVVSAPSMLVSFVFKRHAEAIMGSLTGIGAVILAWMKQIPESVYFVCVGIGIMLLYKAVFALLRKILRGTYAKMQLTLWQKLMICYLGDISRYSALYKEMRDDLGVKPEEESPFLVQMRQLQRLDILVYSGDTKTVTLEDEGLRLWEKLVCQKFCEAQEYARYAEREKKVND